MKKKRVERKGNTDDRINRISGQILINYIHPGETGTAGGNHSSKDKRGKKNGGMGVRGRELGKSGHG